MTAYSRGNFFLKNTFLLSKPEYPFDMGVSNTGCILTAGVAKLVDAPDLGSGAARRGGSSPSTRTTFYLKFIFNIFSPSVCQVLKPVLYPGSKV